MSWGVEAIGVVSGAFIYGAMAFKGLVIIKALLLAGAIGFLAYGVILSLPAIMIINSIGVCLGVYGLVQAIRVRKKEKRDSDN